MSPHLISVWIDYESKYGSDWHFDIAKNGLARDGGKALVFRVPARGLGCKKGENGQNRLLLASRAISAGSLDNRTLRVAR